MSNDNKDRDPGDGTQHHFDNGCTNYTLESKTNIKFRALPTFQSYLPACWFVCLLALRPFCLSGYLLAQILACLLNCLSLLLALLPY